MSRLALVAAFLLLATPARAQAPPTVAPPTVAPPTPAALPTLQTHPPGTIAGILGRRVTDAKGDEVGRLVDVLTDRRGRVRAAIIDVGGFLGIGMRRVAIAWETMRVIIEEGETHLASDLTLDEIAATPEFRGTDTPIQVLGPRRPTP